MRGRSLTPPPGSLWSVVTMCREPAISMFVRSHRPVAVDQQGLDGARTLIPVPNPERPQRSASVDRPTEITPEIAHIRATPGSKLSSLSFVREHTKTQPFPCRPFVIARFTASRTTPGIGVRFP